MAIVVLGFILVLSGCNLINHSLSNDSLIPVKIDNKWGYINYKGEYLINPQFDDADLFSEGLAKVRSSEGTIGYIDHAGKNVIPAVYMQGTAFFDGLAFVASEGGYPICIDKNGNTQFELKDAEYVFAFSEGLAMFANKDEKYGFVDKTGKTVINAQFDDADPFDSNITRVMKGDKYGFIGKDGKFVINPQFEEVEYFSEGKAAFYNGAKWGYIDTNGAYVINPQFDDAGMFDGNMALVRKGNLWGYIDKKGTYVINPQFDDAGMFDENMALVRKGNLWGYIDKKGAYVINPQFDDAEPFSEGLALVRQGNSWGYINKKGKFEINPQFDEAYPFVNGLAVVKLGNAYGYINKQGKFEINPQFDAAQHFYSNITLVQSVNKWGFIDKKGQYVVNPQFDEVRINFSEENMVKNDYYDVSEFIKLFFEKDAGNSFDGFNATTTLQNLVDNRKYGKNLKAVDDHRVIFGEKVAITKDISIRQVLFYFNKKIRNYNGYDFEVNTVAIGYPFNLQGETSEKGKAVAIALKVEIERRHQRQMKLIKGLKDYYVLFGDDNKPSFIIDYDTDDVFLLVGLKTEKWDCGDNGNNVTATLIGGNLFIRGTGAMKNYDTSMTGAFVDTYTYDPPQWTPWGPSVHVSYYLSNVVIEDGVTSIGDRAFYWCENLVSVTIPNSVTTIGEEVFEYTNNITKIINHATIPQKIKNSTFDSWSFKDCTLYVPAASVSAYRAAEGWKEFRNIRAITNK